MTVKVSLRRILCAYPCQLIILWHNFFPVRIIDFRIFRMRITRISHCKMRTGFFCNQYRQLISNPEIPRHAVSRRICPNGKLSHWQRIMLHQYIFADIPSVLCFICKIGTCIIRHHSVGKNKFQIFIIKLIQVHAGHMQNARSTF